MPLEEEDLQHLQDLLESLVNEANSILKALEQKKSVYNRHLGELEFVPEVRIPRSTAVTPPVDLCGYLSQVRERLDFFREILPIAQSLYS